ncbi:MAG: hypothetical protein K9H62_13940 [Bacteroidales bacterium]|nr:hypothetical protein [Bacteroidales bacterium]
MKTVIKSFKVLILCVIVFTNNILTAQELEISIEKQDVSYALDTLGAIDLSVTGGTSPYTFHWGDSKTGSRREFLPVGEYKVTVSDDSEPPLEEEITIPIYSDIDWKKLENATYNGGELLKTTSDLWNSGGFSWSKIEHKGFVQTVYDSEKFWALGLSYTDVNAFALSIDYSIVMTPTIVRFFEKDRLLGGIAPETGDVYKIERDEQQINFIVNEIILFTCDATEEPLYVDVSIRDQNKSIGQLKFLASDGGTSFLLTTNTPSNLTPDVAALMKFVDIPVGLYTGTPNITIPIHEISENGVTIPIQLQYHSNGIKVEQIASRVGLGWALIAGGNISRVVRGIPDERFDWSWLKYGRFHISSFINNTPISNEDMLTAGLQGFDYKPDIFYFSIPGYSGKFVFNEDGIISLIPKQNLNIEYGYSLSGLGSDYIRYFIIYDDKGNKYRFGKYETSQTVVQSRETTEQDYMGQSPYEFTSIDNNFKEYTSSWHLTSIEFPNSTESITFEYEPEKYYQYLNTEEKFFYAEPNSTYSYSDRMNKMQTLQLINGWRLSKITYSQGVIEFLESANVREDLNDKQYGMPCTSCTGSFALDEIEVYNTQGDLVKDFQLDTEYFISPPDYPDPYNVYTGFTKRLKLEKVYEQVNGVSNYSFEYWKGDDPEDSNYPYLMPRLNSEEQDFWGYYNGNGANNLKPNFFVYENDVNNPYYKSIYSIFERPSSTYDVHVDDGADRGANDLAKIGILERINYPTGGYTKFEYELNNFELITEDEMSEGVHSGGGLRINKITSSDGIDSDKDIIREFEYTSTFTGNTSGRVVSIPDFFKYSYINAVNGSTQEPNITNKEIQDRKTIRYSDSQRIIETTGGSVVGYIEVTEKNLGNGKTVSSFSFPGEVGEVEELYSSFDTQHEYPLFYAQNREQWLYNEFNATPYYQGETMYDNFPYLATSDIDNHRGNLIYRTTYNESGAPLKEEEFEYITTYFERIFEVDCQLFHTDYFPFVIYCNSPSCIGPTLLQEDLMFYDIRWGSNFLVSSYNYLSKKSERVNDIDNPGEFFETVTEYDYSYYWTDYFYSDHIEMDDDFHIMFNDYFEVGLLESQTSIIGNDIYRTELHYPYSVFNYSWPWNVLVTPPEIFSLFYEKKIIGLPMEVVDIKNNMVISSSIQSSRIEHDPESGNDFLLPDKKFVLEISNPIPEVDYQHYKFDHIFFNNNPTQVEDAFVLDEYMEIKSNYDLYDVATGNLMQTHDENNIYSSILWGYNSTLPIAIITNAKVTNEALGNEASFCGFEYEGVDQVADNQFWNYPNTEIITDPEFAHTGERCLKVTGSQFSTQKTFIPDDINRRFVFSAWVKTDPGFTGNFAIGNEFNNSAGWAMTNIGDTDGEWIYVERIISIPPNLGYTEVSCWSVCYTTQHYYIDDIRFHPVDAEMITYTHKPLVGVTSKTDANNITTYYEYDDYRRLEITKDHEGNILGKNIYKYINE